MCVTAQDAASLSVAILQKNLRGSIFLGCDNHTLSWLEMSAVTNDRQKYAEKYGANKYVAFKGRSTRLCVILDNSKTRARLGWQPKYPSLPSFLDSLRIVI